jgi:hypothetical protein
MGQKAINIVLKKSAIRKLRSDHPKAINVPHNWVRRTNTFWDYIGDRELDVFRYMSTKRVWCLSGFFVVLRFLVALLVKKNILPVGQNPNHFRELNRSLKNLVISISLLLLIVSYSRIRRWEGVYYGFVLTQI